MPIGFPTSLLGALRCTFDAGTLTLESGQEATSEAQTIRYGRLICTDCRSVFPIREGIAFMMVGDETDAESAHDRNIWDQIALGQQTSGNTWYHTAKNWLAHTEMEIAPTLAALQLHRECRILELGCGDGRYTQRLMQHAKTILAVDYSVEALRMLQRQHVGDGIVGCVHGDVQTLKVCPGAFDRALSTLTSNVPWRHRNAMYELARRALTPNGRFMFSAHHHGFRQMLEGVAKEGHYNEGGIYRYNFTVSECKAEVASHFRPVSAHPIQVYLPLVSRLPLMQVAISRILEWVPVVNKLGCLVLCTAARPFAMMKRNTRRCFSPLIYHYAWTDACLSFMCL